MIQRMFNLRRLIVWAFHLGIRQQQCTTLRHISLCSTALPDDNVDTVGKRYLLNQIAERISPGFLERAEGFWGEADAVEDKMARTVRHLASNRNISEDEVELIHETIQHYPSIKEFLAHVENTD